MKRLHRSHASFGHSKLCKEPFHQAIVSVTKLFRSFETYKRLVHDAIVSVTELWHKSFHSLCAYTQRWGNRPFRIATHAHIVRPTCTQRVPASQLENPARKPNSCNGYTQQAYASLFARRLVLYPLARQFFLSIGYTYLCWHRQEPFTPSLMNHQSC